MAAKVKTIKSEVITEVNKGLVSCDFLYAHRYVKTFRKKLFQDKRLRGSHEEKKCDIDTS